MQEAREIHQCQCPNCSQSGDHPDKVLHRQMNVFLSRLNEQERRWFVGLQSKAIGYGGDVWMSQVTGLHVETIRRGRRELEEELEGRPVDRVRLPGGGRPPLEDNDPDLIDDLKALVNDETGGDPEGRFKFVRPTLRSLSRQLDDRASPPTIRELLCELGFSVRINAKRFTGKKDPLRDVQFQYIRQMRELFRESGWPTISVDSKKKELIGNFASAGGRWCNEPDEVNVYDFPSDALYRATPYGIYDNDRNEGHICVGISSDTPQFAVDAIQGWFRSKGRRRYGNVDQLLIEADAGGSNGCRPRLWKYALQQWADTDGLEITVCHYPTGASKWNPIEHRLFSFISLNWAGYPLRSLDRMLSLIRGTKTEGGLTVGAVLNKKKYRTKIKISDEEMRSLNIQHHTTCPKWNYTIKPRQ